MRNIYLRSAVVAGMFATCWLASTGARYGDRQVAIAAPAPLPQYACYRAFRITSEPDGAEVFTKRPEDVKTKRYKNDWGSTPVVVLVQPDDTGRGAETLVLKKPGYIDSRRDVHFNVSDGMGCYENSAAARAHAIKLHTILEPEEGQPTAPK